MTEKTHAIIAGAGIGGLTAALALARAGFRVSVLERAALIDDVGAGLQLSANATCILRDLGLLVRGGFRVERVLPVDLMPQTDQVEVLALLERG